MSQLESVPRVGEDMAFQRREWWAQRVGGWLLAAFVAAAALGVFGQGPLSRATAGGPALSVEYERFVRVGARTRIEVQASRAGGADGPLLLEVGRGWFESVRIERIVPEPAAIEIADSTVTLRFDALGPRALSVLFDVEPLRAGRRSGHFNVPNGEAVRFGQLAYF